MNFPKLFLLLAILGFSTATQEMCTPNNCITFSVGPGTGCDWMCNYCATNLGPSYYFTSPVCAYQTGGCAGNPIAGVSYTCCST